MVGVGKTLPTGKKILDDIYLSFFYGAKIGVLGLNGAGKSTLLKIIAGKDEKYDGEIQKQPGLTIGLLEQEPDPCGLTGTHGADVGEQARGHWMRGAVRVRRALRRGPRQVIQRDRWGACEGMEGEEGEHVGLRGENTRPA